MLRLVRERYPDFDPTFAAEKLAECHDLHVSKEALRQLMIAEGLWIARQKKYARIHQPRHRRDCLGELVQIDGSLHPWFETRGPKCTLLVFIDDATSRLMHLMFAPAETTLAYMAATKAYIERHGKPAQGTDLHRPLSLHDDLAAALTRCEERSVTKALTLHYNKMAFLLKRSAAALCASG